MQGALVCEVAVAGFAMIAETLSVIGQQHDERPLPPAGLRQRLVEAAEDLIDVADFRIVSNIFRQSGVGGRLQFVGRVQVEEMNEYEYRLPLMRGEPLGCSAQDQSAVAPDAG